MFINIDKENKFINFFLIFFICLTPFSLPFSIFISDLSLVISSIIFLLLLNKDNFKRFFFNRLTIIFICWYVYLLINSLLSENIFLSLESSLFYFRFFIYSLSIWYCLENINNFLKYFFFTLLLSFSIVLFDSYFQYIVGFNLLGFEYNNQWNRLSSFFNEEYILGSYLSRILPIIIALFFNKNIQSNNKIFYSFILIILSTVIILFSGERSALINLLMFFVLFIFIIDINLKKLFTYFTSFIIIIIIFINFNADIRKRMVNFSFQQLNEGGSLKIFSIQHQLIYETSYKIFLDNKIRGIGPKNFRVVCKNYQSKNDLDKSEDGCSTSPHNIYLQLLVETGIIGFMFIFILFFVILIRITKIIFRNLFTNNYYNSPFNLFLIPCFISLWPIIPSGNFFNNWINIIYFLPFGFLMFNMRNKRND
ncbi:MAG: hypothetical protein CMP16_01185 [Rickettsiales bacterium]|nr:hypothetical protein [Rickettsiales bacterium]